VSVHDGRFVGSVIGTFDGWRGNIYRLAVLPDMRRQGCARSLVAEVERRLVEEGARRISALVEEDRPWAMAFWQSAGYEVDARTTRYVKNFPSRNTDQIGAPPGAG
jgi:ribosomal protein S18 acetylase RimI-like enzyme